MKTVLNLLFVVMIVIGAIITTSKLYIVSDYVTYVILGVIFINFIAYNAVNIDKDESDHVYSNVFMSLLRHLLCVVVINGIILLLLSIEWQYVFLMTIIPIAEKKIIVI